MDAIAIVGMAGRFPQAANLAEYWRNLCDGVEGITHFREEELIAAGIPAKWMRQSNFVPAKGFLEDAELFDASFFGYPPRDAELLDPQQRLLLECAWTALEDAGYAPDLAPRPVGVFMGVSMNTYLPHRLYANRELMASVSGYQVMLGNDKDYAATRISYALNLTGPSLGVQTACSTSLVAAERACWSLVHRECDMALAGGASLSYPRKSGYVYQEGMILSPDGHCRVFDAEGRGTVAGEGVGVVVLKRLTDALADGDSIYAVIRGWAANNDGSAKLGFTAPGVAGQVSVIKTALARAGVSPRSISYVEAHGTGTELGDPVEISALTEAFSGTPLEYGTCRIGSVKSNIGHLDAASGVAGLIKTALVLKHRRIPPSLHFHHPNPRIDWAHSPFRVNTETYDWPAGEEPRRAGISSFGIGGTNAHLVLEEPPPRVSAGSVSPCLFVLSGRTPSALETATAQLAEYLREHPQCPLDEIAYTLQVGRKPFACRRAILVWDRDQALRELSSGTTSMSPPNADPYPRGTASEQAAQWELAARIWLDGGDVDWQRLYPQGHPRRISLPTYPFERSLYLVEPSVEKPPLPEPAPPAAAAPAQPQSNLAGRGAAQRLPVDSWFSIPCWKRSEIAPHRRPLTADCWLLFLDDSGLGERLQARLRAAGQRVVAVRAGSALETSPADACRINPELYGDYIALFAHLGRSGTLPQRIVHLWSVSQEPAVSFDEQQFLGFYSLLFLSQVLGRQPTDRAVQIDVISNRLHEVTGHEQLEPEKSTLRGPLLVVPQEYPQITLRSIDVELRDDDTRSLDGIADAMERELAMDITETEVALRGRFRWVHAFQPLPMEPADADSPRIRPGGVYWLIGGLGKIGLQQGQALARAGAGWIILTGRHDAPPRDQWDVLCDKQDPGDQEVVQIRAIRQMEILGAKVLCLPADVSNPPQLRSVLEQIDARCGTLHGLLVSAGLVEGRIIHYLSRDDCELQFRAKPIGLYALAALVRDRQLDFCMVTSSLSAVVGGIGFCAYAAANAFLDAFVAQRNGRGPTPWYSVNWDGWRYADNFKARGLKPDEGLLISDAEGSRALDGLLTMRLPERVVVSTSPLESRIEQWVRRAALPREALREPAWPAAVHPRPASLPTEYVPPRTDLERTIADVWQQLLGIDRIGVHDNYIQLGGQSLMGGQLIARLRNVLKVPLSIRSLFETMTVARLAEHVETQHWALDKRDHPTETDGSNEREEFEV